MAKKLSFGNVLFFPQKTTLVNGMRNHLSYDIQTDMTQHECTQTLLKIIKKSSKIMSFVCTPSSVLRSFLHLTHLTLQNVQFEHFKPLAIFKKDVCS